MQLKGPELRDIHLPPDPPWWPPALGWWMLAVFSLLLVGIVIWFVRQRRRASSQRRKVLGELDRIAAQYKYDGDSAKLVAGLHQLLRRVARHHDVHAARQRGDAWRRTLSQMPVDAPALQQLVALDEGLYRPPAEFDHVAAIAAVRSWLQLALKPSRWKSLTEESANA